MRFSTLAVHTGQAEGPNAPLTLPIYQTSTYAWDSFDERPRDIYARDSNPNRRALEEAVAALEGGAFGVSFSSGMAAIMGCLELAKQGEHVLVANDIYGGTFDLAAQVLPRHGVDAEFFNSLDPAESERKIRPNTRLVVFESPTNPTLQVCDISAICEIARAKGIRSVFDNTFASPYLQNPLSLGADIVVHSTTKYLGGHSDVVGGVAVTHDAEVKEFLDGWVYHAGSMPGPFDCWLVCRGIRSLAARMRVHCENALRVAEFLDSHPKVQHVNYPGLRSHREHELATRQMRGFGAMLSFAPATDAEGAKRFATECKLIKMAASLGGPESLFSYPPVLSHAGLTPEERHARGIPDNLLRMSVGLEDAEDLIEDLDRALATV